MLTTKSLNLEMKDKNQNFILSFDIDILFDLNIDKITLTFIQPLFVILKDQENNLNIKESKNIFEISFPSISFGLL